MQRDLYVVAGDDFFRRYKGGETIRIPVGISAVTNKIPGNLKIEYSLSGWNQTGERFEWKNGEIEAKAEPFSFVPLEPVSVQLPDETSVMVFSVALKDGDGNIHQRNFFPLRVDGKKAGDALCYFSVSLIIYKCFMEHKTTGSPEGKESMGNGLGFF